MLFNSYEFIFLFMPITLIGFHLLRRLNVAAALGWLTVASLVFYAWWRPTNVLIIVPSILFNFTIAKLILRLEGDGDKAAVRRAILVLGVTFNLFFLGYFKYLTFFQASSNQIFGTDFVLTKIILPLGISFITFQKIAFLVDTYGGRIKSIRFREFTLFVLFFPQLIAGPIVHYREMMPQYRSLGLRCDRQMLAAGLTLFCIGLSKKVLLADGIAEYVAPIYAAASAGDSVSLIMAWIGAIGFTLQIYFDFSGYSDMAAGLALAIGVRLPLNFDSPLRASNIIDFWARWHVTLTRFLTAYVYNPITMRLTRRRFENKRKGLSAGSPQISPFLQLLVVPTMVTMLLSGLWHGAGYTFLVWGALHGLYLCVNHAWQLFGPRRHVDHDSYEKWMRPFGVLLTFVVVTISMVWFRADNVPAAIELLQGMAGANGVGLPAQIAAIAGLGSLSWVYVEPVSLSQFATMAVWVIGLLTISLAMPNSFQLLASQAPVLDYKARDDFTMSVATKVAWRPSVAWFFAISLCLIAVVMRLGGQSEFLYWQF